jgi:hypothetical protein
VALDWASAVVNSPQEGLDVDCAICFIINKHKAGKLQIAIIKFYFSSGWVSISCIALKCVIK